MCFNLKVINQFSSLNASILKLQCEFIPDITIIPAVFNNPKLTIAIVAPLNFINNMRTIIEKFQCVYPYFTFFTHDGTCIRNVHKGEIIGKGNINGFDENNFGKIFIPTDVDKVIIVLNNHRSKSSVLKNKIKSDLETDFNKLKENMILAIEKRTIMNLSEHSLDKELFPSMSMKKNTSIDLFIDYPLAEHLKKYELEYLTTIFSDIDNINIELISTQIVENYCVRFLCETYFGLLESVSNKGVNIELNIENLIYYTTETDISFVQIAYNQIRKTFTLIVKSNECIEFDVILFLSQNITSIIPFSEFSKKNIDIIDIIESDIEIYPYLDGEEFSSLMNLLQYLDIPSISKFNIYRYKFLPIPLFTKLNNIIPAIEFKHLLDYMWKKINEEEIKYNKDGYQSIFRQYKKIKPINLNRLCSSNIDYPDQLFSYFDNNIYEHS